MLIFYWNLSNFIIAPILASMKVSILKGSWKLVESWWFWKTFVIFWWTKVFPAILLTPEQECNVSVMINNPSMTDDNCISVVQMHSTTHRLSCCQAPAHQHHLVSLISRWHHQCLQTHWSIEWNINHYSWLLCDTHYTEMFYDMLTVDPV